MLRLTNLAELRHMPRKRVTKTAVKTDWRERITGVAKSFGPDGTLFTVVAVGAFAALVRKVDPGWVWVIALTILGLWLALGCGLQTRL